jgi:TonB family protein
MDIAAASKKWVGQVIDGRFTLLEWLGGTEASGVFLTELPEAPARKAAIKLTPADGRGADAQIAVWARTKPLFHPHLMRLFGYGRCTMDGLPLLYSVTEYSDEVLSQILSARPLTPAETTEMLDPVLKALGYLHAKGFVHGHLKPANILVVDEQIKLSSDGLLIANKEGRHFSATEVYDAPEAADGNISAAADIWSLGVMLVEVLTQHPLRTAPAAMPQPFAGIVRACLRPDPERRCTLDEVKSRLEPARLDVARPVRPLPDAPLKTTEPAAPARSYATLLVATVLVLLGAGAFWLLHAHQTPATPPPTEQPPALSSPAKSAPAQNSPGATANGDVAQQVQPDVLPEARASIHGEVDVTVRVTVDASGNVSNAALDSAGPSKYFAKAAQEAAAQWKFKPAPGKAGRIWTLQFQFTQAGTTITPAEGAQ